MLRVHPESCQSQERQVRAAKSQEVGSQHEKYDADVRHPSSVLLPLHLWQEKMVMNLKVTGLFSDSRLWKWDSTRVFDLQGSGSRSSPCGTIADCCIMASICSRHSRNTTKMKSGLWFRCIFGSVSSINVILTHTKKGQSKQVHFRELKPHLIGQTPGLEMYSFFF